MSTLEQRLQEVEEKISAAVSNAGRARDEVKLIVVSKNHPASLVLELIDLGIRSFGENRDQEAAPKAESVAQAMAGRGIEYDWHFIGQLQSNKVKSAIGYANTVHSLDRQSLLDSLIKATTGRETPLEVFIQLNLTQDPARGGIEPKNLALFAEQVLAQQNLKLLGVMGVASLDQPPERDFEIIRLASQNLTKLSADARFISAGMSEDFEAAISLGATHLRIGSAITGKRQY